MPHCHRPAAGGVIVDDEGTLLGTVRAYEVLAEIEERARPELDEADLERAGLQPIEETPG